MRWLRCRFIAWIGGGRGFVLILKLSRLYFSTHFTAGLLKKGDEFERIGAKIKNSALKVESFGFADQSYPYDGRCG